MAAETIRVTVCYGIAPEPDCVALTLAAGATLADAVAASGLAARHPQLEVETVRTGVYGKLRPGSTVLHDDDRVELYAPLVADPKTARRKRVDRQRATRLKTGTDTRWRPPAATETD